MFKSAAAVLVVTDMAASLAHYRDAIGFEVAFEYGEPPFYAGLRRDDVIVHLMQANQTSRTPGQSAIYAFVDDVDALHAQMKGLGAHITQEPQDYPYGMRDFMVRDLDGNQLAFGTATAAPPS
ncbi:MAG: VOC family protein [Beijerinckiaceae bacterium]|nr:VOC family protein [Beijerinckiaceae bacterium]